MVLCYVLLLKEIRVDNNTGKNAGERLWQVQKNQGTGLCVGLDPHYEPHGVLNEEFYGQFARDEQGDRSAHLFEFFQKISGALRFIDRPFKATTILFLVGLVRYYERIIDAAWGCGIRAFKPQSAFYERLTLVDQIVLSILCQHIHELAGPDDPCFIILDAKRGDIDSTQEPYYAAYLSKPDEMVMPGVGGKMSFDAMTVTTWMGNDVLTPGLPFFKTGRGAIIVTRSSNPSGTTLQDMPVEAVSDVALSEQQKSFRLSKNSHSYLYGILGRDPTAHEVMLNMTTTFSNLNSLNSEDGVSPLFSVMGSTVKMDESFRKIRGNGAVALVPGFGHQGGVFDKIEPLLVREGPLTGHWGILASSRAHNFPWMEKYGGAGSPRNLEAEMARAIDAFRNAEREAYVKAGAGYPF